MMIQPKNTDNLPMLRKLLSSLLPTKTVDYEPDSDKDEHLFSHAARVENNHPHSAYDPTLKEITVKDALTEKEPKQFGICFRGIVIDTGAAKKKVLMKNEVFDILKSHQKKKAPQSATLPHVILVLGPPKHSAEWL